MSAGQDTAAGGTSQGEVTQRSMSLRDIQAQGGRIGPPQGTGTRKKFRKHHTAKAMLKPKEVASPQDIFCKLRQSESGQLVTRMDPKMDGAQRNPTVLHEQVKHLKDEHGEMKQFLRDILYTLNARGYQSITDCRGEPIDLNRCRGDNLLDLKGRDARARQCPVKRLQGHEHLLKAVIGSQEKLIRNLINEVKTSQRSELIGSRLSTYSTSDASLSSDSDREKSAILEKEILGLVNSLEAAIERHPGIYSGLKEQLLLEGSRGGGGRANGILSAVLARHQLACNISLDDNSNRLARLRRKLLPYSGEARQYLSEEDIRPSTVGKAVGLTRDRNHPRPPTPGIQSGSGLVSGSSEEQGVNLGVTFRRSMMLPLTSPRPMTSINEYSSRKLRRGISRWVF